jgi:hypothetical protein
VRHTDSSLICPFLLIPVVQFFYSAPNRALPHPVAGLPRTIVVPSAPRNQVPLPPPPTEEETSEEDWDDEPGEYTNSSHCNLAPLFGTFSRFYLISLSISVCIPVLVIDEGREPPPSSE